MTLYATIYATFNFMLCCALFNFFVYFFDFYLFIHLFIYLIVCLFIYLFICLFSSGVPMVQEHCMSKYNASIEELLYHCYIGEYNYLYSLILIVFNFIHFI